MLSATTHNTQDAVQMVNMNEKQQLSDGGPENPSITCTAYLLEPNLYTWDRDKRQWTMDKGTGTLPFDPSALLQLRVWLPLSSWLMGIPGLLGALKSVTYPIHVSSYRGLTVGVDAYCW